jgi:pilin isopeptide linkage protein
MTKDGDIVTSADFVNRYTVEGEDSVVINGTKELIGKELSDGEFTFELKDKADGTIFSVKNENGTFKFVLNYTEADVGKVFEYELYEVNDGAERVTYDESVYNVVVTVSDDQNGNIITEATITKDGIETTECSFTNVYTPKPDDITVNINVNKVVENIGAGEIGPEGFEFILENIATGEKTSVFSDENGNAMFTLAYSEADIGNRYSYKVYEINDGRENVTYSDVVYNITVSVTLGEDNKLYATVLNGEEATDDAVCEFVNVYNELPPAKPGDTSKTITWMIVLISSACGLSVAYAYGKKKEEDEE